MANDDLQAWTNAFYQRMQNPDFGVPGGPIATPTGATLADLLLASRKSTPSSLSSLPLQHADPIQSSPNLFERGMDLLSRGSYAAGNAIDALSNNLNPSLPQQDVWSEIGKGITGEDKTTPSQVIDERTNLPGWAQFGLGLATDITLDPLNLIPGKAIASGARAVRGAVSGATKTARSLEESAKVAKVAQEAEASELAAQKLAEADALGTTVDPSITDQVLHEANTTAKPETAESIKQMLADLEKTHADTIKEQIPGQTYLDPETVIPTAQRSRVDLRDPVQAKMEADLANVVTPDDMKAWRALYKDQFPKIEQTGLSSVRDVTKFKSMATNFMSRAKPPEATALSDVLLNPEAYHPDTIADVLKSHSADSLGDMAHKYRFVDDTMDTEAKTLMSGPAKHGLYVNKTETQAANTALDDAIAAQKAAREKAEAIKDAEKSAKQAEATPTRTTPPKVIGNEAQGKAIQRYVKDANKRNAEDGIRGRAASTATREHVLNSMQKIEDHFRAGGDDPFVHTGPLTAGTRRFSISTTQAIRHLVQSSPEAADLVDTALFNASTGIGTEAFQQGVAEALRLADDYKARFPDEVWDAGDGTAAQHIHDAMVSATDEEYMKRWTHPTGSDKAKAYFKKMQPVMEQAREDLAYALADAAPELHAMAAENLAKRGITDLADSKAIADSVTDAVDHAAENSSAAGLKEISESIDDVKTASDNIGASPKASYAAAAQVASQIAAKYGVTAEQVRRLRQVAEARAKNGENAQAQAQRLAREQARADAKEADEIGKEALGVEYDYDMSQQFNARFTNSFMKTIAPLGRMFSYGFKAGEFATILKEGRSAAYTIGKRYERLLTDILRSTTKEERLELHDAIRMGRRPADGTKEAKLFDDLKESYDITYDTSVFAKDESPLFTNWFSQGIPVEEMNKQYAAVGLKHRFKPPKEGEHWSDVPNQWRDWEVDDPIDFAHKSFEAMQRIAANKSVATHAAEKWGVKKRPGAGWVKLTDKGGESSIIPYMDTSLYYPEELAHQISNLDWMMNQAVSFAGSKNGMGKFVREVVDPYMQLWKPLITIAKPGHHLRNITGDFFISALDIGFTGLGPAYAKAARIMHGNRAFEGAQAIQQTASLVEKIGPNAGKERIGVVLRGGKKEMLDDANVYKLAFQRGMLPEFTKSEDLIRNEGTGLLSKAADKIQTSKPMQKVGEFAEYTSHVGRMAHFVALMERKSFTRKFSSLEEASRAAAERVKKFHPDTSGLSPFEQKNMRRLFPFYTWIRQTAPVVMGALFTNPARVMAVPKIQYNIALQMGVNPDSLGNPFPDGSYPSWMRDSMTGPVGPGGTMLNLGSPQEGILPDYLSSNPLRSAGNMLTPFIKQPLEALSGTKIQTGSPLQSADQSEFWDQIVPGASTVAQLTSTSPVGSVGNIVAGEGLDPVRNVVKDEQDRIWNRNLLNFLTGLSVTNAKSPTAQNSAHYERMRGS